MRVVFRADASRWIGTGHVRRCVTLGKELIRQGVDVHLITRSMPGDQSLYAEEEGLVVHRLTAADRPLQRVSRDNFRHAHWLGTTAEEDRRETEELLRGLTASGRVDWLVVDHYGLDAAWERPMRSHVDRVMAIDDLADREHAVDLLLDQNEWADGVSRYDGLVDSSTIRLVGARYSLLAPEYSELHDRLPSRTGPVQRVLIFFGGTDELNVTGMALQAVHRAGDGRLTIDVVLGGNHPHEWSIRQQTEGLLGVTVHDRLPSLAGLMALADLAVGASGTTSWERCALGLPAVVVTVADNQLGIGRELTSRGLAWTVGRAGEVQVGDVEVAVRGVLTGNDLAEASHRCRATVDGRGASRVSAVLAAPATSLVCRQAVMADASRWKRCALPFYNGRVDGHQPPPTGTLTAFESGQREVAKCRQLIVETSRGLLVAAVRFWEDEGVWLMSGAMEDTLAPLDIAARVVAASLTDLPRLLGQVPGSVHPLSAGYVRADWRPPSGTRIAVCSDRGSWVNGYLPDIIAEWVEQGHEVCWAHDAALIPEGDVCFYLSYGRIVSREVRNRFRDNLVVHGSDLPEGRGWSPLTWQVLEGRTEFKVTLLEAADDVDAGDIYLQSTIRCGGHELIDEMRAKQTAETLSLCRRFIDDREGIRGRARPQQGVATFYPRRRPDDSALDPYRPVADQFRLLRVVDNERYPAWFELNGHRYWLRISRYDPV